LCRYAMGQLYQRARAKDVGEGSNVAREAESTEAHGGRARHHLGKVDGHNVRARPQWLSVPPIQDALRFGSQRDLNAARLWRPNAAFMILVALEALTTNRTWGRILLIITSTAVLTRSAAARSTVAPVRVKPKRSRLAIAV